MRLAVFDNLTDAAGRVAYTLYKKAGIDFATLERVQVNQIMAIDWERSPYTRIDACGEKSLLALTGKKGIDKWRGSPLALIGETKTRVMPTLDFATLMGQQDMIPTVISDLKKSLITPPEFYNLDPTIEDLRAFDAKYFALDIETGWPKHNEITVVGLCDRLYHGMCVPFREPFIGELRRIVSEAEEIITHNGIAFDCPRLFTALGLTW